MEVAGDGLPDSVERDPVRAGSAEGGQPEALGAVTDRQQFAGDRVGHAAALGGEHSGLLLDPLQGQFGEGGADAGEEVDDLFRAAGAGEVGDREADGGIVLEVQPGERAHRQVLDQVRHPEGAEGLVLDPAAEHQGGFERAGRLGPDDGDAVDDIVVHRMIIHSSLCRP